MSSSSLNSTHFLLLCLFDLEIRCQTKQKLQFKITNTRCLSVAKESCYLHYRLVVNILSYLIFVLLCSPLKLFQVSFNYPISLVIFIVQEFCIYLKLHYHHDQLYLLSLDIYSRRNLYLPKEKRSYTIVYRYLFDFLTNIKLKSVS